MHTFRVLPFELRRSIISFHLQNTTRYYSASAKPPGPAGPAPRVYRGRNESKQEESPSPLSPFSHFKREAKNKAALDRAVHDSPKAGRKNVDASDERVPRAKKRPKGAPAKPSNSVVGTSPTRKLLVTPASDRVSRMPVWARPPTTAPDSEARGRVMPPVAKSWAEHRSSIKSKYPEKWEPSKKVSREAMDAIRELHKQDPEMYPSWVLAQRFTISPEAVRRILKSKFKMSEDKVEQKIMKERKRRIERMKRMREEEMHQMVRAGIQLKEHPDDQLRLK